MARGTCANCKREDLTIVARHLCGGCFGATKNFEKGTPEYDQALKDAKERFTNGTSLPRGRKKSKFNNSLIPEKQKKEAPVIEKTSTPKPKKQDVGIILTLEDRRHELMAEVDEINKTIEVIKRYQAA